MRRHITHPFLISLGAFAISFAIAATGHAVAADGPSPLETRLRDTLKSMTMQLRDAQSQVATLQASQADSDEKNKQLTAQLDDLTKVSEIEKTESEKTIADLKTKLAAQATLAAKLKESLEKWQHAEKEAADTAHTKESERSKLQMQVIVLQRLVDDRETKNVELFKIGNEILTRYEKFSLGEALLAKEPFTGITKVKLEGLVQDYQDKLLNQKVEPGTTPASVTANPTPAAASAKAVATAKSAQ